MTATPNTIIKKFNFKALGYNEISDVIKLQNDVLSTLKDGEKHFFKYRGLEVLTKHLDGKMPLIGLFKEGKLSAMVMLTYPDNPNANNMEGYPISENSYIECAVVQSLLVSPSLQGCGASSLMIDLSAQFALRANRDVLWAKVARGNEKSLRVFERSGLMEMEAGVDPKHGYPVKYLAGSTEKIEYFMRAKSQKNLVRLA